MFSSVSLARLDALNLCFCGLKLRICFWPGPLIPCWDEKHRGQSFVSVCGFIYPARMLSSSAGPCSHMPHQWHGYFNCSELQNPQSSTDQRPLLWAGHNDHVDIDRPRGLLSFTECPVTLSCMRFRLSLSKQVITRRSCFLLSLCLSFSVSHLGLEVAL